MVYHKGALIRFLFTRSRRGFAVNGSRTAFLFRGLRSRIRFLFKGSLTELSSFQRVYSRVQFNRVYSRVPIKPVSIVRVTLRDLQDSRALNILLNKSL